MVRPAKETEFPGWESLKAAQKSSVRIAAQALAEAGVVCSGLTIPEGKDMIPPVMEVSITDENYDQLIDYESRLLRDDGRLNKDLLGLYNTSVGRHSLCVARGNSARVLENVRLLIEDLSESGRRVGIVDKRDFFRSGEELVRAESLNNLDSIRDFPTNLLPELLESLGVKQPFELSRLIPLSEQYKKGALIVFVRENPTASPQA